MPDDHSVHPRDHNNPPVDLRDQLLSRVDELVSTADKWKKERPEITSGDHATKATDFLAQLRECLKKVEAQRKMEKQPHIDAGKAVDEEFSGVKTRLERSGIAIKGLLTPWLMKKEAEAEAERKRKEEAARKAEQEAEALARKSDAGIDAAIAAENATKRAADLQKEASARPSSVNQKGDYASRAVSLRTNRHAEITDVLKAARYYKNDPKLIEVLKSLAGAEIRAAKGKDISIPGVEVVVTKEAA
jgi:hypothetical protein